MEKWRLKEIIKGVLIAVVLSNIFILVLMFLLWDKLDEETIKNLISLMFPIGTLNIPIIIYVVTIIKKKKNEIKTNNYNRDIDSKMTPAIASLILDGILERKEAILATILDLHTRKYLNIDKYDNEFQIKVVNKEENELYSHEKYVVDSIRTNNRIKNIDFKKLVEKDAIKLGLINENESIWNWGTFIFFILALLVVTSFVTGIISWFYISKTEMFQGISKTSGCIVIMMILILRIISPDTSRYISTKEGRKASNEMKELKNFLKDYTLLKEKEINYLNLADRYLPFAIALGENEKIENKYIINNDYISKYIYEEE